MILTQKINKYCVKSYWLPEGSCKYRSTLDVVVEGAVFVPVFVQNAEGIDVGEILKLYQTAHPVPAERQRHIRDSNSRTLSLLRKHNML